MPINANLYKRSKLYDLLSKIIKKKDDENFDLEDHINKLLELISKSTEEEVNYADNKISCLHLAVQIDNPDVVSALIEKGANLNNASDDGIPPLSQAVAIQNFDAVDLILAQDNTDMYFVWGDVWTGSPVYMCVSHADTYTLEQMIKKGLDINHDYSEYGATPIMLYAVAQRKHLKLDDYKQLISFLILNKADINKSDNNGVTPLMLALKHSDIEGFNALIVGGADTKLKDNSGKTAMDYYNEYVKTNFEIYDEDKSRIQSLLK